MAKAKPYVSKKERAAQPAPSAHAAPVAHTAQPSHESLHARGANSSREKATPDTYAIQHSAYNWRSRENLRKGH